jgi:peptide/nickel transport system substrate-binding protein
MKRACSASAMPRRLSRRQLIALLGLVLILSAAGCAPTSSPGPAGQGNSGGQQAQKKIITVAYGRIPTNLGPLEGGVAEFREMAHAGLLALDPIANQPVPRLADAIPAFEHGTMVALPDGRLETRYRLRPGIKWHDGTPFSSQDFVFGWLVQQTPNWPSRSNPMAGLIDAMETPDESMLVITWKTPTRFALRTFTNSIWPMPRHLLGPLVAAGDIQAVADSSYWTRDFVGVGAFKLTQWVEGSHWEFAANDDYVLGRPRIDTLIWRLTTDRNAGLAGVLAGQLDVTMSNLLDLETAQVLQQQWDEPRRGTILLTPANWRWVNLMPTNPLLSDLRVRRAMIHALDREGMSRDLFNGLQAVCDIWVSPRRPQFAAVDAAIAKYPYDPARSRQLFEEAGWRMGPDGLLVNGQGQRFVIDGRTTDAEGEVGRVQLANVDDWRRAGVQVDVNNVSSQLDATPEYRNQWTGAYWASWNLVLEDLRGQWHTSVIPRPENRFSGGNRARWSNPRADTLIEEMSVTLEEAAWDRDLIELARLWTDELPHLPLYYINEVVTYGKGIRGVAPRSETGSDNTVTWNVHEWSV